MKKAATLLVLLAVLIGVAWFFGNNRSILTGSQVKMRELLLPDFAINDVRKIHIHEKDQTVDIAVQDGQWRIPERNGYPAAYDKIHRALMSLLELKIGDKQVLGKSALADLNLLSPKEGPSEHSGLLVEFLNEKGGTVASFIAGKNVEATGGASSNSFMGGSEQRFVRVLQDGVNSKDQSTIWIISDSLSEFQPKAEDWIDKAFVDVRKLKSVAVTTVNPVNAWKAARADESAAFILEGGKPGEELDTAKASGLSYLLSGASFTDVLTKDKVTPELFADAVKADLDTFEGFHYHVEAASKKDQSKANADSVYYFKVAVSATIPSERKAEAGEKPEDKKKKDEEFAGQKKQLEEKLAKEKALEGWVYEVSNTTLGVILKKKHELLREKPAGELQKPTGQALGPNGIPPITLHGPKVAPPTFSLPSEPVSTPGTPSEGKKDEPKKDATPPAATPPAPAAAAPKPADKPAQAPTPAAPSATPPAPASPPPAADAKPETKPAPAPAAPDAKPSGS